MQLIASRNPAFLVLLRLVMAGLIVAGISTLASAQYCTPDQCDECLLNNVCTSCCNEPPELWLVYTRHLPKCGNLDNGFERISVKRWDAQCRRWVRESHQSFLASEAANPMPTLVFAHGNTLNDKLAMNQCWEVYGKLRCCPGKKRLVFWSWPAQVAFKRPIIRPRQLIDKNLKAKFVYSEYQGYYMAKFVQNMTFSNRVTLGGHSYGGIMAAVGAHFLGGGSLRGWTLPGGAPVERPNLRVALISGAFDNDAMLPGHRYGQTFVAAEKVLNTRNITDKTLRKWPRISMCGRRAVGVTGVNANLLGQYSNKLCQITMTRDVGRSHYIGPHLSSGRLLNLLCCFSFPQSGACPTGIAGGEAKAGEAIAEDSALTSPKTELETNAVQPGVTKARDEIRSDEFSAHYRGGKQDRGSRAALNSNLHQLLVKS